MSYQWDWTALWDNLPLLLNGIFLTVIASSVSMPIPGDLLWFDVSPDSIDIPIEMRKANPRGFVDIAVFYGRNNFLLSPQGFMPGNLFATITEGLSVYAKACGELFREGVIHERFIVRQMA